MNETCEWNINFRITIKNTKNNQIFIINKKIRNAVIINEKAWYDIAISMADRRGDMRRTVDMLLQVD